TSDLVLGLSGPRARVLDLQDGLLFQENLYLSLSRHNITRRGCRHLSKLLREDSSLASLDLGLNPIAAGSWCLCEALKKPSCNLRCLGLCSCSIPPSCCQGLASVLLSAQRLETLDLGQNILGRSGITVLLEALKQNNGPLKSLRLEMDESSTEIQKLLKDVKDINPNLTIECSDARATRSLWGELLPLHPEDLLSDPVP
uniref:Uncharacterized protein n=1 Tax=Suricata suricatta TaxID=37032 RepID=A0A673UJW8_SURSU